MDNMKIRQIFKVIDWELAITVEDYVKFYKLDDPSLGFSGVQELTLENKLLKEALSDLIEEWGLSPTFKWFVDFQGFCGCDSGNWLTAVAYYNVTIYCSNAQEALRIQTEIEKD